MRGGEGDDLYVVSDDDDVIDEAVGQGFDGVLLQHDFVPESSIFSLEGSELEYLIGGQSFFGIADSRNLIGNDKENVIINQPFALIEFNGSSGPRVFGSREDPGPGAADTLDGGAGDDFLDGGRGGDNIFGGAGADWLIDGYVDNAIRPTSTSIYIADMLEFEGVDLAVVQAVNTDSDTLSGGAGDDVYLVDSLTDSIIESRYGGTDAVYATVGSISLVGGFVENLFGLSTGAGQQLTGNNLNNAIVGNVMNDTLAGGAGTDSLSGGLGLDQLNGGAGNDTLDGGAGDDTLTSGSGLDRFVFGAGTGVDTITDFTNHADLIDLRGNAGASSFDGVGRARVGANVELTVGVDKFVLQNVALADVDASDFPFGP